jgi:single-strand DNA-binding protein
MSLNRITLIGHLGHNPELIVSRNGLPLTTLRVAVNQPGRAEDGTATQTTDWFEVVVFDHLAERCAQFLAKGSQIYAEGRLKHRNYTDRAGQVRTTTEIIAERIEFLGKPHKQAESNTVHNEGEKAPVTVLTSAEKENRLSQAKAILEIEAEIQPREAFEQTLHQTD